MLLEGIGVMSISRFSIVIISTEVTKFVSLQKSHGLTMIRSFVVVSCAISKISAVLKNKVHLTHNTVTKNLLTVKIRDIHNNKITEVMNTQRNHNVDR